MRPLFVLGVVGGGVLVSWLAPVVLASSGIPAELRVAILFKALSYDARLAKRCRDGVRVLVVAHGGDESSVREGHEMQRALGGKSKLTGLTISVRLAPSTGAREALVEAASQRANTILLTSQWPASEVPAIVTWAQGNDAVVVGNSREQVQAGAATGVYLDDGKPRIGVSVRSAMAQGARFDSGLLRLAEVFE